MSHRPARNPRKRSSRGIVVLIGSILLLALSAFLFWPRDTSVYPSLLIIANPSVVVSWNSEDSSVRLVTIPVDIAITAPHARGQYALEALWRLDTLEHKKGELVRNAVEDALGYPIAYIISTKEAPLDSGKDSIFLTRDTLRYTNIFTYIKGDYMTNMPLGAFLWFAGKISGMDEGQTTKLDLSQTSLFVTETLPDGSRVKTIDPSRLDVILGRKLEDTQIRREALRINIFNTTRAPLLGTKVAKLLGHMGMLVVSVGNDSPELSSCRVGTREALKKSYTVQFIKHQYHCDVEGQASDGRVDVSVWIGNDFQARYEPEVH